MTSYTAQQAKDLLKPQLDKLLHATDHEIWDVVESFYHPNGVLVHKDKECTYGNKAITEAIKKFAEGSGKAVATIFNEKFSGVGDYLMLTADMSTKTEKMGTVNASVIQIWKKEGERHLLFHDEFVIVA